MARKAESNRTKQGNPGALPAPRASRQAGNLGFEDKLWAAADKLRGNMDAAEYKHVVLGLIFPKYISDAFQEKYDELKAKEKTEYTDPEDRDEYAASNIFWVPKEARWKFGIPPANNANYAWIQHFIHHLAPHGIAGFVMANGSMSTSTTAELEIGKNIIEADMVDCMIALPGQLFYTTQIPVCLWFLVRNKKNGLPARGGARQAGRFRDRRGKTLFIDARKMGELVDRVHRELTDDEIERIARTYHAWRGEEGAGKYKDIPGFCNSVTIEDIREHGYVLTPGRYVGTEAVEDDGEPFEEKMKRLTAELQKQFRESARLDKDYKKKSRGSGVLMSQSGT